MKRLLCTLVLSLVLLPAMAQIRGTVTDGATGEPFFGVSVLVKGTTIGTDTQADGSFSVPAKVGDILQFSFIGYVTQEVTVTDLQPIAVILQEDVNLLEEIVVVGYGSQKKSDVTGAVASFNAKQLEERPTTNLIQSLQGAVAGLNITMTGSDAEGSNSVTRIRGNNSISASNKPLIILDGIPFDGSWSEINTNDVESIEVLKDASSAAIYGARGANGVILIQTKKGKAGDKTVVSYNGYWSFNKAINIPEMMDGETFYRMKTSSGWTTAATEEQMHAAGKSTNWLDLALRYGHKMQHNLSVRGAGKTTRYYVSANITDNKGVAIGNKFQRYAFNINFEQDLGKWVKYGTNTRYGYFDRSGSYVNFSNAYLMNPLGVPYNEDGSIRLLTWEDNNYANNPLSALNEISSNVGQSFTTNNYIDVNFPVKGLTYRLNTGYTFGTRLSQNYQGLDTVDGSKNSGVLSISNRYSKDWLIENILSFPRDFGKHTVFLTGLYSAQFANTTTNSINASGFPNDVMTYWQPNKAAALSASAGSVTTTHISQMLRANYSYDSRYLVTATVRRDGFSGFGVDKKYGLFYSLALGWNVAREGWFKDSGAGNIFNELKLRVSYGKNGNESISAYATLPTLSTRNYLKDDREVDYGYYPTKLESTNLGWETTRAMNVGLDFGLLKNRIHGTLDLYDNRTSDLLLVKTIPSINGAESIWENIGQTHSYGIELGITAAIVSTRDFIWETALNFTANRTKLVDVGLYDENGNPIDDIASGYFIGYPLNCYYDYVFDGIYQIGETNENTPLHSRPGYVRYKDLNGDDAITPADKTVVGAREPKFDASLTNTFRYKGLYLTVHMTGRYGTLTPNFLYSPSRETYNTNLYNRPFWSETNPIDEYPSCERGGASNPMGMNYYRSADFFKVKDATIGWRLPEKFTSNIHVGRVECYVNCKNLLTLTEWVGLDPEFVGSAGRQRNIPQSRQYTFGVKINL